MLFTQEGGALMLFIVLFTHTNTPTPVLTDILCATIFPPMTASAVHSECPIVPPIVTPNGFCSMKINTRQWLTAGYHKKKLSTSKITRVYC